MTSLIQINGKDYQIDLAHPIDISIPLNFRGPQPNAFGVEAATSKACEYGTLIGDTRRGGSCNFEQITFIPLCNGTHTECVGHITNERISVRDCLIEAFMPAILISVGPQFSDEDLVISDRQIREATGEFGNTLAANSALIMRTLPNDNSKLSRLYDSDNMPPYFTREAAEYMVECGFKHLLVDLPSIDRLSDGGKLLNHRAFWNVNAGSFETNSGTRLNSTITELIYVPNEIPDGEYLLNLQIAPFVSDASPSRPLIFPVF